MNRRKVKKILESTWNFSEILENISQPKKILKNSKKF